MGPPIGRATSPPARSSRTIGGIMARWYARRFGVEIRSHRKHGACSFAGSAGAAVHGPARACCQNAGGSRLPVFADHDWSDWQLHRGRRRASRAILRDAVVSNITAPAPMPKSRPLPLPTNFDGLEVTGRQKILIRPTPTFHGGSWYDGRLIGQSHAQRCLSGHRCRFRFELLPGRDPALVHLAVSALWLKHSLFL